MPRRKHLTRLLVRSARYADVYKDTVRVSESDRAHLRTGRICRFKAGEKVAYAVLRGLAPNRAGQVLMDEAVRDRLQVRYGEPADLVISEAGFWGRLKWGWDASDPTYATATRLGVLSLVLGILSFALALATAGPLAKAIVELSKNPIVLTRAQNR